MSKELISCHRLVGGGGGDELCIFAVIIYRLILGTRIWS